MFIAVVHCELSLQAIEPCYLLRPEGFVGGLEYEGYVVKSGVLHEQLEATSTEDAFAKAVVAVDTRAEPFLGIVEVHASQVVEAYNVVELAPCAGKTLVGGKVVAGSVGVAGVYAHSHSALVLNTIYDGCQVSKVVAHVRALSGCVLDNGCNALGAVEGNVYALGDALQACIEVDSLEVAAGVEVEACEPQSLATLHLADERVARLFEPFLLGMTEVDEVAIVRKDVVGGKCILLAGSLEGINALGSESRSQPLALVLGKEGKSLCTNSVSIGGRIFYSSLCADVRSYVFHIVRVFKGQYCVLYTLQM